MSEDKGIENKIDDVLQTDSVKKAERIIKSRSGLSILAAISFAEAALPVPILTDPFLIAAILVNRSKTFSLVLITTIASVLGGVFAYFSALLFFETILEWMTPAMTEQFNSMVNGSTASTFMLTMVGAVTPVPYTFVAWVVGLTKGSLAIFITASVLGRGGRYIIVGLSTYYFGSMAISYAKKYIGVTSILILIGAAAYFWLKM